MKSDFKDGLCFLLSLFFPNRCIFCNKLIDPFQDYCDECKEHIPFIKGEICTHCGASKKDCECDKRKKLNYASIISPLYYLDNVKNCIHRFKFNDERTIAKPLARLMLQTMHEHYSNINFDYITYIPMYSKRERHRGYNQSRLLARELSKLTGIKFADKMLVKLYDTDNQHECTGLERTGNLIGVFDVSDKFDVKEKNILLIDDVKTSGATLNECGKMLYLYDASGVFCLTASLRNSKI